MLVLTAASVNRLIAAVEKKKKKKKPKAAAHRYGCLPLRRDSSSTTEVHKISFSMDTCATRATHVFFGILSFLF